MGKGHGNGNGNANGSANGNGNGNADVTGRSRQINHGHVTSRYCHVSMSVTLFLL